MDAKIKFCYFCTIVLLALQLTSCERAEESYIPIFKSAEIQDTLDTYLSTINEWNSLYGLPLITSIILTDPIVYGEPELQIQTDPFAELAFLNEDTGKTQSCIGLYKGHYVRLLYCSKYSDMINHEPRLSYKEKIIYEGIRQKYQKHVCEDILCGKRAYEITKDGHLQLTYYRKGYYEKDIME